MNTFIKITKKDYSYDLGPFLWLNHAMSHSPVMNADEK